MNLNREGTRGGQSRVALATGLPILREAGRGAWKAWAASVGPRIEEALQEILPPETERPRNIHRAMRYAVFSGGKRIRPCLSALGFTLSGGRGEAGIRLGAAIELIHTFSLIHDDLPCMDDDDYRRGRASCHKKFGEAIAVLAGDGLQVLAFQTLASLPARPARRLRVLEEITRAVGTAGVIGGQVVDIESEGKRISRATLRWMHEHKTGALLRASLVTGAVLAGGAPARIERLAEFGRVFGLLFQIVDDLLGEVGTRQELGRPRGRDRLRGKATYPALLGLTGSRQHLRVAISECLARVPARGSDGEIFVDLIGRVAGRLPEGWLEGAAP